MIENLVMMAYSGAFGRLYSSWMDLGVIEFLLPFLIIFSLVFLTLKSLKLFKENNAITAIIAISVALIAMSLDLVPIFFSTLFPRLGVGLVIILSALILLGLFTDFTKPYMIWTFFGLGALVLLGVFISTLQASSWDFLGTWGVLDSEMIISIIVLVVIVVLIVGVSSKGGSSGMSIPLLNPAGSK